MGALAARRGGQSSITLQNQTEGASVPNEPVQEGWKAGAAMLFTVVIIAPLLIVSVEGWAPAKNEPVRLRRGGAPTPAPEPLSAVSSRFGEGVAAVRGARRRLQLYDRTYEQHPDETETQYNFDQPTHQGARRNFYGHDPVKPTPRDPDATPSPAEMYPLLLDVDAATNMELLATEYQRKEEARRRAGVYTADWCERSGIKPGLEGCSFEASTFNRDANGVLKNYYDYTESVATLAEDDETDEYDADEADTGRRRVQQGQHQQQQQWRQRPHHQHRQLQQLQQLQQQQQQQWRRWRQQQ